MHCQREAQDNKKSCPHKLIDTQQEKKEIYCFVSQSPISTMYKA